MGDSQLNTENSIRFAGDPLTYVSATAIHLEEDLDALDAKESDLLCHIEQNAAKKFEVMDSFINRNEPYWNGIKQRYLQNKELYTRCKEGK